MVKNEMVTVDWTPVVRAQEQCAREIVQRTANAILKKTYLADNPPKKSFSFGSAKDIDVLYTLAAYLFVFEQHDLCCDVCGLCDHVEFTGDFTLWSYIRSLRCMQIAVLRMKGEPEKADVIFQKLKEHEIPEENRIRVWKTTKQRALGHGEAYREKKSSSTRYAIMGTSMICLEFLIMGYLLEEHEIMKEWMDKIFVFLRAEEK